MAIRRNLREDPSVAIAGILDRVAKSAKSAKTGPTGTVDFGETDDAVWTDPASGKKSSVRELPALIDATAIAIDAAKAELEETRGDIEDAKGDLEAERAAREQALAEAAAALAELDEKLNDSPSTADLDAIRSGLATAREVADSATVAATEANTAAVAASQAALEAAGIAASKGRVIVSETEPTGADRTASNIWIQPVPDDPTTEVKESAVTYVYLEASDEWQATTSSELAQAAQNALDAREAAQQAQQRADTAMSNAATAQAAAEAAQRTANQATLDAADSWNAAIAAQAAADAAKADALLSNLCFNPGFEQAGASPSLADGWATDAGKEYRDTSRSRSGSASLCLDPRAGTGVAYVFPPPARYAPVSPERQYKLSAWVYLGADGEVGTERQLRLRWYDASGADLGWTHAAAWTASTARGEWVYVESATAPARAKAATARVEVSHNGGGPAWIDDVALRDVTEVVRLEAAAKTAQDAATAAQDAASGIRADLTAGPSLWEDPGFERGKGGVPAMSGTAIARSQEWAASGTWSMKYTASGAGATLYGTYGWVPVIAGRWYAITLTAKAGDAQQALTGVWAGYTKQGGTVVASNMANTTLTVPAGTVKAGQWVFQVPDGVTAARYYIGVPSNYNKAENTGQTIYLDEYRLTDVTDSYPRYLEAKAIADSKATPEQVAAAEKAAKDAAAADATAKAAQAKADALAGAATDAASKAAAAQAAAEAAAAADAKTKADKALADALAALATARGEITAEIKTSANGKNAITVSTSAPSSSKPGVVVGDTWWRVDGSGQIFGQWAWSGSAWVARTIRSEVIANLDVGKLVVTGSARFTEAVVDRMFADIFTAHKITATELSIGAVGDDGELVPNSVRGVHIQNGTVSANKLVIDGDPNNPDEVGLIARIASIMKLAVENLVVTQGATIDSAVILKLASEMVTAGVIRTAETGQRVVVDKGGVVLIGLDDDGFEYELVRLGPSGENLLTIGETTVAPDGIATPSLEAGAVSVNGVALQDMIGVAPQGVVAWAYSTYAAAWDGTGNELRRLQVDAVLQPGRRYSVTLDQHWARLRTGATSATFVEFLRFEAGASASEATTSSAQLAVQRSFLQASTQSQTMPALVGWLDTADLNLTAERRVYFLFTTRSAGGRDARIEAASGETLRLTVRDEGPSVPSSGRSWMDQGTPSEGSADAPPAVPVKIVRTEKFAATRAESWNRGSSSFLSGKSGTVYQGKYPSVSAREGAWWFNTLNGNLSGATIKRVQLRFYIDHTYWGAGGTADVRLHGKTSFSTGGLDTSIRTLKVKRNAQYSIDVPASYLDGFRTGTWRGFGLSTSSTNLEYYVQARLANAEIWITYEK